MIFPVIDRDSEVNSAWSVSLFSCQINTTQHTCGDRKWKSAQKPHDKLQRCQQISHKNNTSDEFQMNAKTERNWIPDCSGPSDHTEGGGGRRSWQQDRIWHHRLCIRMKEMKVSVLVRRRTAARSSFILPDRTVGVRGKTRSFNGPWFWAGWFYGRRCIGMQSSAEKNKN